MEKEIIYLKKLKAKERTLCPTCDSVFLSEVFVSSDKLVKFVKSSCKDCSKDCSDDLVIRKAEHQYLTERDKKIARKMLFRIKVGSSKNETELAKWLRDLDVRVQRLEMKMR